MSVPLFTASSTEVNGSSLHQLEVAAVIYQRVASYAGSLVISLGKASIDDHQRPPARIGLSPLPVRTGTKDVAADPQLQTHRRHTIATVSRTAACLIASGVTRATCQISATSLSLLVNWLAGGIPITMMMNMERRHGHMKPVIRKALVELDGAPFLKFAKEREAWKVGTCYTYPGPIQYFRSGRGV